MTVGAWLRSRTPVPPTTMLAGMNDALGERASLDAAAAPTAFLDAGVTLLEVLLRTDVLPRDRAGDLLTADALVTYAFEAAASSPMAVDDFATAAMTRLAALAESRADGRKRE